MKKISKLLIANRGEIALRVMRSAKEMGIATVAVYSEADRNALHVRYADEAVCIGPPPSSQSYLSFDKIVEAVRLTGADAVHPGYGFLSENAEFARRLQQEKIILLGPSPEAMEMMGSKLAAKAAAKTYNIPMVPGTDYSITDHEEARKVARQVGYPVLIKASAGGGGKGMRVVEKDDQFLENLDRAISEATSAFGDGSVFIERFVTSPRHIEIQIMADNYGNVVYLFERECSIQRRHQKVIEEAPSSILTPALRKAMGESAVQIAKACNYSGAGTVEFLVDEHMNYYFLEMNTRLQVEHPVTEMITGIDLVKEQIRVAEGAKLSFRQEDLQIRGHAIEVRVYAEDPTNNFLPDIGRLQRYVRPQGPGVRVDDGFEEGMDIPIYYDPMIAKLVAYGADRKEAIARMIRAIDEYKIVGCQTTLPFCRYVMQHDAFLSGHFDTNFVKKYFTPDVLSGQVDALQQQAAAMVAILLQEKKKQLADVAIDIKADSAWKINRR